jgi:predicted SAM-dependent methyltransferase
MKYFPDLPVKLDLGAGDIVPEGYRPLGRGHNDTEVYPLSYADNSVDVIRASHILEHFSHKEVDAVLADWVRALKPGGILRIAVPDFENVARGYLEGKSLPAPIEWVVMGAQSDDNDYHKSVHDREHLRKRMAEAGLVLLRPWQSEIKDCAEYPISLNIEGTKPSSPQLDVSAVMSVPRLGWMDNFGCVIDAILPLGIKMRRQGGAFWGQALTRSMEISLDDDDAEAVLAIDYDSLFTKTNVARLIETMMAHPEADAIACVQSSRHLPTALFTVQDEEGKARARISMEEFEPDLKQISTAHFGLTLLRASKLKALPRPWFIPVPDSEGRWVGDDKIDEDINFWVKWRAAGNTLYLANRIPIGHIEVMGRWPGKDLQAIYQPVSEFNKTNRPPEGAWE